MYILFSFFPGVKINYVSSMEFSLFKFMDYLVKNFFYLWQVKLIASVIAVFISYSIKRKKLKKYGGRHR